MNPQTKISGDLMVKDFILEPSFNMKWEIKYTGGSNTDSSYMSQPSIIMKLTKASSSAAPVLTTTYDVSGEKGITFRIKQTKPGSNMWGTFYLTNSSFQMTTVAYDYEYNGNKYFIAQNQGSTIRLTLKADKFIMSGKYTIYFKKDSYIELPSGCLICCLMPATTESSYNQEVSFGVVSNATLPTCSGNDESETGIIHNYGGKIDWNVDGVGGQWLNENPTSKISLATTSETPKINISSTVHDYVDLFNVNVSDNILAIDKDASFVIPNDVDTTTDPPTLSTQTITISQMFQLINSLVDRLHALEVTCANMTTDVLENAAPGSEAERLAQIKEQHKNV